MDEGILRLTHQANPDPAAWYFGKRALGLAYRDDYGRLLDPNLGAAAAIRMGGDGMGEEGGLSATPIKTVALWSGVVDTDPLGHATVHLPASPDFNGQLRLVAVAWTDDAVGSGASDVIVREPVVVELSPPRFLAPGDRASAALEVHDVEGRPGSFIAELFGRNGIFAPFRQLLQLVLGQRVVMHADIAAPDRPGVGRVDLHVAGPGYDTTRSYPLQTRFGWGPVTRATVELQRPGEAFTPSPALLAGLSPGGVTMTVSYSPFRGFDPAPIAESLSRYPYGCSEQLVSTAAPILYGEGGDPRRTGAALAGTVGQLMDRESLDGSFGLWSVGDSQAEGWLGAYVVDFLLEARARGAPVPQDAMARARSNAVRLLSRPEGFDSLGYLTKVSADPFGPTEAQAKIATDQLQSRTAAYALYDLAKARQSDLPRLRWFHDVGFKTEQSALARAQVGAGLAAMGDRGRAHDSFLQAARALDYKDFDDPYQSTLRDLAGVIALAYEAGETGIARSLQGRLENAVRDPDGLNTQEQAFLLRAAHAMFAAAGPLRVTASGARPMGGARWAVGRLADARFANGRRPDLAYGHRPRPAAGGVRGGRGEPGRGQAAVRHGRLGGRSRRNDPAGPAHRGAAHRPGRRPARAHDGGGRRPARRLRDRLGAQAGGRHPGGRRQAGTGGDRGRRLRLPGRADRDIRAGEAGRPLHRRHDAEGRQAVRGGLRGAGGDAGRLLPPRGGGARHVPAAGAGALRRRAGADRSRRAVSRTGA